MTTKQIVIAFAVLVLVGVVVGMTRDMKSPSVQPVVETPPTEERNLCYYRSEKTDRGFYDRAWIRLSITGGKVVGEFNNYPAEKDSKVGIFTGTYQDESEDGNLIGLADVIWNSSAEGMQNKEELLIEFFDADARPAFGEMIQGANRVYVYKDKTNVTYQTPIPAIDCAQLDEIKAVEAHVRTNISTITTDKAVLGGTWYVTAVVANPSTDTAEVEYEDGHIAGKGVVAYTFDNNTVAIVSFTKDR